MRMSSNQPTRDQRSVVAVQQFSGPLPPPEIMERYDALVPGAAERILHMAEKQSEHRHRIESRVIASDVRNSFLGLIFGFFLSALTLSGSIVAIMQGKELGGGILGGGTVASLAAVFVYGSRVRRANRERQD
jgi:uncharacterized membrane protein